MDASLRNTRELTNRIDKLQADLIKRFQNLVDLAAINNKDRSTTAVTQYQMQVETAALVRAAEDVQSLIRQLQEMWLFGRLETLGESEVKRKTEEDAKVVGELLGKVLELQRPGAEVLEGGK